MDKKTSGEMHARKRKYMDAAELRGRLVCGGVVGCLLFVAAGGRRGRGDLCRCSQTGPLKTTP